MNTNNVEANSASFQSVIIQTLKSAQAVGSEVYEKGKELGNSAIDVLQKEIPDVISQLMTYEYFYHLTWLIVCLGAIIGFWVSRAIIVRMIVKNVEDTDYHIGAKIVGFIICFLLTLVVFFPPGFRGGPINHALTCIKIKTAPKVFLIEYVNGLIKGKNNHEH